eukprot:scaffold113701_cov66-Phaeocystis_antarctica.AAC.4
MALRSAHMPSGSWSTCVCSSRSISARAKRVVSRSAARGSIVWLSAGGSAPSKCARSSECHAATSRDKVRSTRQAPPNRSRLTASRVFTTATITARIKSGGRSSSCSILLVRSRQRANGTTRSLHFSLHFPVVTLHFPADVHEGLELAARFRAPSLFTV